LKLRARPQYLRRRRDFVLQMNNTYDSSLLLCVYYYYDGVYVAILNTGPAKALVHLLVNITVLIFGDYYVAFWGLLLSSISGIIQATRNKLFFGRAERIFQDGSKNCDKDCD
jgi:hypothetical protein